MFQSAYWTEEMANEDDNVPTMSTRPDYVCEGCLDSRPVHQVQLE
jgi:hypothetical protein